MLKYFKIRVSLLVNRPLWGAIVLNLPFYGEVCGMLRYECLSNFYQQCSHPDHNILNCSLSEREITVAMLQNFPYELWLNENGDKGTFVEMVLVELGMEYRDDGSGSAEDQVGAGVQGVEGRQMVE